MQLGNIGASSCEREQEKTFRIPIPNLVPTVLDETSRAATHVDYHAHRTYGWTMLAGAFWCMLQVLNEHLLHLDERSKFLRPHILKIFEIGSWDKSWGLTACILYKFDRRLNAILNLPRSSDEFVLLPPDLQANRCASCDMPSLVVEDPESRPGVVKKHRTQHITTTTPETCNLL